jgi:hypothetical protein
MLKRNRHILDFSEYEREEMIPFEICKPLGVFPFGKNIPWFPATSTNVEHRWQACHLFWL